MRTRDLNATALTDLRAALTGDALTPGDPGYDEARKVFNGMIDRRPGVVAQCESPDDVVAAVRCASETRGELAVRGGGHSVAGQALTDGGVVADLRRMNDVTVDPDARTAVVGGGALMRDLDQATQPYGLATTGGRVSTTGVGGFTLGGGSGWLDRDFGLACDNLLAAELVTADGLTVRASDYENPELFWALHGGGGNFGAVTSLTLRLHPLPVTSVALLLWPPEAGPEVTRAYRDLMADAPDALGGGLIYITGPPEPFVPEPLVGRLTCAVLFVYDGRLAEARELVEPLLRLAPSGELITEMPYAELQRTFDVPPDLRNYWSAEHLEELPDEAVDRFCARADDMVVPSPSEHVLLPLGGAVGRAADDYPVPWRHAPWVAHPLGVWEDPADDDRGRRWARAVRTDLAPWSAGAVYLNFIGDEGEDRVVAGYGADNHKRLAAVKGEYDPGNLFSLNHNITPG